MGAATGEKFNLINGAFNYPKPRRFPLGKATKIKKKYLSNEEVARLLRGKVVVEEKMDGKMVRFRAERFLVFAEDLKRVHSIYYKLPGRYAIFDVFDSQRGVFLYYDAVRELGNDMRKGVLTVNDVNGADIAPILFFPVPLVAIGLFGIEDMPKLISLSAYAIDHETKKPDFIEGIVVKPWRDLFPEEFLTGKLIREEFTGRIKKHYLNLPIRSNIIDPNTPVAYAIQKTDQK